MHNNISTQGFNFCAVEDHVMRFLSLIINVFALTLSVPGYFRQLTIWGRALKAPPPPPTISKIIVSIFTISYMCILPGVLGMFQLEFFKNARFSPFYSDFKIKSSENSCRKNILVILFNIDFKYPKRRRILMQI